MIPADIDHVATPSCSNNVFELNLQMNILWSFSTDTQLKTSETLLVWKQKKKKKKGKEEHTKM